jgi:hypothetical protein
MGGPRIVPFTKNREFIYDFLSRAKKYHCSVSGTFEFDVTDLLAAIAHTCSVGRDVSIVAALVRATSLLLEKFPNLNRHLFHSLFGRKIEVEWDEVSCTLILMRLGEAGEQMLFPLVLRSSNRMSVDEVQAAIQHHKHAPLDELPQVAAIRKLERLPNLALRYFSYKARSDWRFYIKHFGTYGLSSLITRGWGASSGTTLANTAAAFIPGTLAPRPVARGSEIVIRQNLTLLFVVDHYLVDGKDMMMAMKHLRGLIEQPQLLGLEVPPATPPAATGSAAFVHDELR